MLGAAVVVVLGLAAWMLWRPAPPAPRPAVPVQARARAGKPSAKAQVGPADAVRLDALKASRDDPGQAGRNPFRFQPKAAPPPKITPRPIETETSRPAPPPGPTPPPPPPPIPLKFTGLLTRADGTKWAVLSDGKSAPMYGRDGDIIDGKYLIVKIGTESIDMSYVDGRGRQVIRLSGS